MRRNERVKRRSEWEMEENNERGERDKETGIKGRINMKRRKKNRLQNGERGRRGKGRGKEKEKSKQIK